MTLTFGLLSFLSNKRCLLKELKLDAVGIKKDQLKAGLL